MDRKKLQTFLLDFYKPAMVNAILRGTRKPKLDVIIEAENALEIPASAWGDIKGYLHHPKTTDKQSTPQVQEHGNNRAIQEATG
jgi:hypothetical protein